MTGFSDASVPGMRGVALAADGTVLGSADASGLGGHTGSRCRTEACSVFMRQSCTAAVEPVTTPSRKN